MGWTRVASPGGLCAAGGRDGPAGGPCAAGFLAQAVAASATTARTASNAGLMPYPQGAGSFGLRSPSRSGPGRARAISCTCPRRPGDAHQLSGSANRSLPGLPTKDEMEVFIPDLRNVQNQRNTNRTGK